MQLNCLHVLKMRKSFISAQLMHAFRQNNMMSVWVTGARVIQEHSWVHNNVRTMITTHFLRSFSSSIAVLVTSHIRDIFPSATERSDTLLILKPKPATLERNDWIVYLPVCIPATRWTLLCWDGLSSTVRLCKNFVCKSGFHIVSAANMTSNGVQEKLCFSFKSTKALCVSVAGEPQAYGTTLQFASAEFCLTFERSVSISLVSG